MKKSKIVACLLSTIISLGLFCSCEGKIGPQGEMGPEGPAGKDGSSFLTGKGQPSNELGKIGDSYLDVEGEKWGFYIKGEDGWKLLGYIETEPAYLTLSDYNGTYGLSHITTESLSNGALHEYKLGEYYFGTLLSCTTITTIITNGTGTMSYTFGPTVSTDITYSIEGDKFIMNCKDAVDLYNNGNFQNKLELSIETIDETMYFILKSSNGVYNFSYYLTKQYSDK